MSRGVRRKREQVEVHTASAPASPPLDEATFQQLLEAAYVIQEQREAQPPPEVPRAPYRPVDASEVLALIAETQDQLRTHIRDLSGAGKLIAERVEQVTNAAGVAIALIREDHLEFCTATGVLASLAGSSTPVGSSLPELLQAHSWSSVERAIRHDAKCPIVFPIFHEGRTTGLLHLSVPETENLAEHQIRTCQVMAGLMGEAVSRVSELEWKQTLAAERTTMMEILERLRPQLERLAAESASPPQGNAISTSKAELEAPFDSARIERELQRLATPPTSEAMAKAPVGAGYACQQCGATMNEAEVFCAQCGAPQLDLSAPSPLPGEEDSSKPLPQRPQNLEADQRRAGTKTQAEKDVSLPPSLEQALAHLPSRDVVERFKPRVRRVADEAPAVAEPNAEQVPRDAALRDGSITLEIPESSTALTAPPPAQLELPQAEAVAEPVPPVEATEDKPSSEVTTAIEKSSPWASAAQTHRWLQSLQDANSPGRVWITKHRADLWVAVSVLLLLLALSGWGSRSVIYGTAQTRVVQPSLTLFERLLVALDLAQPPPSPVYVGNPNVQVWVDLHTALYYCPGAELYGKTAQGRFTTQRDAQLDQFEPAARKYCQ